MTQHTDTKSLNEDELLSMAARAAPADGELLFPDRALIAYRRKRIPEAELDAFERRLAQNPRNWERLAELVLAERSRRPPWALIAASLIAIVAVRFYTIPGSDLVDLAPPDGAAAAAATAPPLVRAGTDAQPALPLFVANGESFYWMDSGVAEKRVRVHLQLVHPAQGVRFAAYHVTGFGLVGIRSEIVVEDVDREDAADLVGELAEFAGTSEIGTHRVVLIAKVGREPRKFWFLPQDDSAVDFRIEITPRED